MFMFPSGGKDKTGRELSLLQNSTRRKCYQLVLKTSNWDNLLLIGFRRISLKRFFLDFLTSDLHAFRCLLYSPNQEQKKSLFHVFVSVNLRCYGAGQFLIEPLVCRSNPLALFYEHENTFFMAKNWIAFRISPVMSRSSTSDSSSFPSSSSSVLFISVMLCASM